MEAPKCIVKKCERNALVAYGSYWICGNCLIKIMGKEAMKKNKEVEELEL